MSGEAREAIYGTKSRGKLQPSPGKPYEAAGNPPNSGVFLSER
jgi:hypothetical protein